MGVLAVFAIRVLLPVPMWAVAHLPDLQTFVVEECSVSLSTVLGQGIYNGVRRILLRNVRMLSVCPIISNNYGIIFMITHSPVFFNRCPRRSRLFPPKPSHLRSLILCAQPGGSGKASVFLPEELEAGLGDLQLGRRPVQALLFMTKEKHPLWGAFPLVTQPGLEPGTTGLKGRCSTN